MQMDLGILRGSMDERVDLSSCQVWTTLLSHNQFNVWAFMNFTHIDTSSQAAGLHAFIKICQYY